MSVRVGDLVEYGPFAHTGAQGLGIVLRVADPGVQLNGGDERTAEVLWAKYAWDGPQWYRVRNLRVVSIAED